MGQDSLGQPQDSATHSLDALDPAGLAAKVRQEMPTARAALLVGSAVTRAAAIADLDVTAFNPDIPLHTDLTATVVHAGWPVHIVAYSPKYFDMILADRDLYFLYYRELRKLRDGYTLFDDDGYAANLRAVLARMSPPKHQLQPVVARLANAPPPQSRDEFLLAVERMAFCWLHARPDYRYSKPKWLMEDARGVQSTTLITLLEAISRELLDHASLQDLALRLEICGAGHFDATSGPSLHFANNLADARKLLAAGRANEAVWPLRMSAAMLVSARAAELGTCYEGIHQLSRAARDLEKKAPQLAAVLRDLFLLAHDVPDHLQALYLSALKDFQAEWTRSSTSI